MSVYSTDIWMVTEYWWFLFWLSTVENQALSPLHSLQSGIIEFTYYSEHWSYRTSTNYEYSTLYHNPNPNPVYTVYTVRDY